MAAVAIRCNVCGGATAIPETAVHHRCEFCGSELVLAATHAAVGAAERRVAEALAQIRSQLDGLDAEARRRAAGGDLRGAHEVVGEHVRRVADIYEQTGYHQVLGIDTPAAREHNLAAAFAVHLARLGLGGPAPIGDAPADGGDMARALAAFDFDGALAAYARLVAHQLATDPRWQGRPAEEVEQVRASSLRGFALGIPWATREDLARHGIALAEPQPGPDGRPVVTCVRCGATVALAALQEQVACGHCGAQFRIRLEGLDVYHARGHTEVTAAEVAAQDVLVRIARGDVRARVEYARRTIADMAPVGSPRAEALTFVYALQVGGPLAPAAQQALAADLGLGPPRICESCESIVALPPGGATCPMCTSPLRS